MLARLRSWFDGLALREQRIVLAGGVAALVLLLLGVVLPLHTSTNRLEQSVKRKSADLAWMRSVAPALAAAGPVASVPATQESLVVLIDRSARESGLAQSLTGSQPSGDGGLRVQLEKADFNLLVAWLAKLSEQSGVRVETATLDAVTEPGKVNAALVLRLR